MVQRAEELACCVSALKNVARRWRDGTNDRRNYASQELQPTYAICMLTLTMHLARRDKLVAFRECWSSSTAVAGVKIRNGAKKHSTDITVHHRTSPSSPIECCHRCSRYSCMEVRYKVCERRILYCVGACRQPQNTTTVNAQRLIRRWDHHLRFQ